MQVNTAVVKAFWRIESMSSSSSSSRSNLENTMAKAILVARMREAVQRSLCPRHFRNFKSFYNDLREFCSMVVAAKGVIKATIEDVFPLPPQKIKRENWEMFAEWLETDIGEPVRFMCLPWCYDSHESIQNHDVQKHESRNSNDSSSCSKDDVQIS
ncbi:hypothetical protein FRX31_022315 [Thalictrum thalictroides]|uniref:Uncharacterized protein n=1 Tax=Thalictrum thalictroides TaxID=46969 RepID=A0A7J6VU35_THATH|nr:hypothetical protein FRX31_022315 [Thalictrum thalictroides]